MGTDLQSLDLFNHSCISYNTDAFKRSQGLCLH